MTSAGPLGVNNVEHGKKSFPPVVEINPAPTFF